MAGNSPTPWYEAMWDDGPLREASRVTVRAGETSSAEIRLIGR